MKRSLTLQQLSRVHDHALVVAQRRKRAGDSTPPEAKLSELAARL